jgi:glycosyltransferase involved in cell wall biosynthesis
VNPPISIIIPTYNGEKTIRQTVDSALSQTFADFELIVIDDGSTDATLEILSQIDDPRAKVFPYPNAGVGGPAVSRNRGLRHATGEYIAFLDQDDLWVPGKLEAQLKALRDNPQAAIAYSWLDYIDEEGRFLDTGSRATASGDVYERLLADCFIITSSNPLIRRQVLEEVGGLDESMNLAEDLDLCLRIAARYHFVCVPAVHVLYRVTANSTSANVQAVRRAGLRCIEQAFATAPESLQHLRKNSIAGLHEYLALRAARFFPTRQNSVLCLRFLGTAICYDPILFWRKPYMLNPLLKAIASLLLPAPWGRALRTAYVNRFRRRK